MPLNTAYISNLQSRLDVVQSRVQRAGEMVSKRQAMPESDPLRVHLIRLALLSLDQQQDTERHLIRRLKEAEIAEAEQLLALAQSPAIRTVLEAEIERLRSQLAPIAG